MLDERRQWWVDQIQQYPDANNSLEYLTDALQELGVSEPLRPRSVEDVYSVKLETFEAEVLPCGYADLSLDVVTTDDGAIDQLMIGASSLCSYAN